MSLRDWGAQVNSFTMDTLSLHLPPASLSHAIGPTGQDDRGVTRRDTPEPQSWDHLDLVLELSCCEPFFFFHLKISFYCLMQGTKFRSAMETFFFSQKRVDFFLHFFQNMFPGCRAFLKIHMRSSLLCLFCRHFASKSLAEIVL